MAYAIAPVPVERLLDARPHRFDHAADHPGQQEVRHVRHILDAVPVDEVRQFLLECFHHRAPVFAERPTRRSSLFATAQN